MWCDDAGRDLPSLELAPRAAVPSSPPDTTSALFILDALAPMSDGALAAAGDDLTDQLQRLGPDVRVATRLLTIDPPVRATQEHP